MKLKDVNINAEDLLNFINNNISFEEPTVDSKGLRVEFFYKVRLSDFMDFVVKQAKTEKENNENKYIKSLHECFLHTHEPNDINGDCKDDNVIVIGETKCGKVIQGEKKERVIPNTTPDQRSIHPSL